MHFYGYIGRIVQNDTDGFANVLKLSDFSRIFACFEKYLCSYMKKTVIAAVCALIFAASATVDAASAAGRKERTPVYKDASAPVEKRVEDLLSRMTLDEKIMQTVQYTLGRNTVENNLREMVGKLSPETGSVIYFSDNAELRNAMQKRCMEESRLGIPMLFGHDVIHGYRTIAPIPLAQAASWNPELVRTVCSDAAAEASACGVDWTFSPMVDVARDPRWGRVMEGYGEDVFLTSVFCRAAIEGYQGDDLSADGKIAACLKHFVGYAASEAGRDYVYTEISDQTLWDTYLPPFKAGVDAGVATVMSAFNNISGVPASANRRTMTEILKERWGFDGFIVSDWDAVIQLCNQGVAADDKDAAALAINAGLDMDMMDDLYRKHLKTLLDEVVPILSGMQSEFGSSAEIVCARGCDFETATESEISEAVALAGESDIVVLCLGEKRRWSGENCSRSSIALPAVQEELLSKVKETGKPVAVLIASGRPVDLSRIEPLADALLEIWMPGVTAGNAVAGILSGKYNPSGRLPMTFPYTTGQIPIYYNRRNSARRGTQGLYKDIQSEPMYEFGYGLSYTDFDYSPVRLSLDSVSEDGTVTASVTVTNTGTVAGKETVQWYICDPVCSIARPVRELKHFEKVLLRPGESREFRFEINPRRDLGFVDGSGTARIEKGEYRIIVKDSTATLSVR